jgi:hypothetical protein
MLYRKEKVDEVTLALLYLVTHTDRDGSHAWKKVRLGKDEPAAREVLDPGSSPG